MRTSERLFRRRRGNIARMCAGERSLRMGSHITRHRRRKRRKRRRSIVTGIGRNEKRNSKSEKQIPRYARNDNQQHNLYGAKGMGLLLRKRCARYTTTMLGRITGRSMLRGI